MNNNSQIKSEIISEIGIDEMQRLYVIPSCKTFPYIYRAAMEVNWDEKRKCLYSPKPKEWSYVRWYEQIVTAVKNEYGIRLLLSQETKFVNIDKGIFDYGK